MSYLHLVLVHTSAWFCMVIVADLYKNGAPKDDIGRLLTSALILAVVLGPISGHAHGHYISYLASK